MLSMHHHVGCAHWLLVACTLIFLTACTAPVSTMPVISPTGTASQISTSAAPMLTETVAPTRIPTGTPTQTETVTATPTETRTPTPTAIPQPLPPDLATLQIVYRDQGIMRLWQSGGITDLAEYAGDLQFMDYEGFYNTLPVLFSDDGVYIAFLQLDGGVWMVRQDGADLKLIYHETDPDIDPSHERPYLIGWLPGTHTLLFSKVYWLDTSIYTRIGTFWTANMDTGAVNKHEVFPNRGARFFPAPDGKHIAGVSSGQLVVLEASREGLQTLQSFPWIATVAWSNTSDSLLVVASPNELSVSPDLSVSSDLSVSPEGPLEVWRVYINGQPPIRLSNNIPAALIADINFIEAKVWIAPDLTHLAYFKRMEGQEKLYELHVAGADLSNDRTLFQGEIVPVVWAPDSQQFVVWRSSGNPAFVLVDTFGNLRELTAMPGWDSRDPDRALAFLATMPPWDIAWIDAENLLLFNGLEFWVVGENRQEILVLRKEENDRPLQYFRQFDFRFAE